VIGGIEHELKNIRRGTSIPPEKAAVHNDNINTIFDDNVYTVSNIKTSQRLVKLCTSLPIFSRNLDSDMYNSVGFDSNLTNNSEILSDGVMYMHPIVFDLVFFDLVSFDLEMARGIKMRLLILIGDIIEDTG
jgi:hypothetical protein